MKKLITILALFSLGCNSETANGKNGSVEDLRPRISRIEFDTLKDWNLAWKLLEPFRKPSNEIEKNKQLKKGSIGQRALYFFYDLDGEVTCLVLKKPYTFCE